MGYNLTELAAAQGRPAPIYFRRMFLTKTASRASTRMPTTTQTHVPPTGTPFIDPFV